MAKILQFPQRKIQTPTIDTLNNLSELYLKGDEFIFNKSLNQYLFEIFMFNCDPKLREWESSHNGLKDLQQILEIFPKDLEDTIKQLQTSNFNFGEPISGHEYSQEIMVEEVNITNTLITQYGLNISKVTELGYTRFFELFCDRYNNENVLESDFQLFTKEQIRYLAVKKNNQDILKTIAEFPLINNENLEYFIQFWET